MLCVLLFNSKLQCCIWISYNFEVKCVKTIGGAIWLVIFFLSNSFLFQKLGCTVRRKQTIFPQDCSNLAVADRHKQMHRLASPNIYVRINLCSKLKLISATSTKKAFPGTSLCGFATIHHSNICEIRPNSDVYIVYCPFSKGGECTDRQTAKMLHFCIFIPRLWNKYTYYKANRTIMDLHLTFF